MMKHIAPLLIAATLLNACKTTKTTTTEVRNLPEIQVKPSPEEAGEYRASTTIRHKLIHTALDVRFDWEKKYLIGKASIQLCVHFYPTDLVWLNARGMQINDVRLLSGTDSLKLKYEWAHDSLKIMTDRMYKAGEPFTLYIDYIAKPEELKNLGGSVAINSDKGLYFINPDGKEKDKPRQIWTQGETQANSVWFPTIDAPNQKMTQEIRITVENEYKTLSNGSLTASKLHADGTRTDTWKQEQPHAPYLAMMAIGPFAVVKDSWRGKEVNYYVEPDYEKVARRIFGNTPEMMEFFSRKTGLDFPWAKYSQVVVRDYVSGAMENTTATVHGDFLQQDERELLDGTNEDVVSHELFHQWFGDYVTCESWSNLPLNESFATYGEYLWNEYKYGREEADVARLNDLNAYFREAKTKKVDLIRFYYEAREDMFDRHSYQKGGTILHMLRKYTGDEAFFASLKRYLENNKYKPVEVHQLRLAFEEVTGEDLNWFFNQWFLDKGHPVLEFSYRYDEALKKAFVNVKQQQDLNEAPLYTLPLDADVYANGSVSRKRMTISKADETFEFDVSVKPDFINMDAEKMLTAVRIDRHSNEEWMAMYRKAPLFQDRFDALQAIAADYKAGSAEELLVLEALKDKNWKLREYAINKSETIAKSEKKEELRKLLMEIGLKDPKADVRDAALTALDEHYDNDDLLVYFKNASQDSSFTVMETALNAVANLDKEEALKMADGFEANDHKRVMGMLSRLYSRFGNDAQAAYMKKALEGSSGFSTYNQLQQYGRFLKRCNDQKNITGGLLTIYSTGKTAGEWVVRLAAAQSLAEYGNHCTEQLKVARKAADKDSEERWTSHQELASKYLDDLKKNETNETLLKIYNSSRQ